VDSAKIPAALSAYNLFYRRTLRSACPEIGFDSLRGRSAGWKVPAATKVLGEGELSHCPADERPERVAGYRIKNQRPTVVMAGLGGPADWRLDGLSGLPAGSG